MSAIQDYMKAVAEYSAGTITEDEYKAAYDTYSATLTTAEQTQQETERARTAGVAAAAEITTTATVKGTGWIRQSDGSYAYGSGTTSKYVYEANCEADEFQGIRFYDGASFGFLRVHTDKVELLVDEPLEYPAENTSDTFDGTIPHTYRITGQGKDINLYIDGVLRIDGTGKFTRNTSEKLIEIGDISGRPQILGSTWDAFRYSIDGAQSPEEDVSRLMQDITSFPMGSIGRLKAYDNALYMSYDPADPLESSTLFKYEEGSPVEKRSTLAVTKSNVTCVLIDPNRQGSAFGSTGKIVGTDRGLQYIVGSKASPFDVATKNNLPPEDQGWQLETNCSASCASLFGDALNIDTRRESGSRFHKYVQRKKTDPWISKTSNSKGWTVEARVKIVDDGSLGMPVTTMAGRDFVFLTYFGETMTPDKSEMSKRALDLLLLNLGTDDRFNVISFSTASASWNEGLTLALRQDLSAAKDFVDALYPTIGANLTGAFSTAFAENFEQSGKIIVLLSDGSSDVAASTVASIVTAANVAGPNAKIYCLGIGSNVFNEDISTKKMIQDIASQNSGSSNFAATPNDLDVATMNLWKAITPGFSFDGTGPAGGAMMKVDMSSGANVYDDKENGTEPDDDINAPSILINDGTYQEYIQFFNGGIRLKYANAFASLQLSQKYYTVRIVGKDKNIAVYAKADGDRDFRRILYAQDALYVRAAVSGEQEHASVASDSMGFAHATWQDSEGGSWKVFYSKSVPASDDVKCSGTALFSTESPSLVSSTSCGIISSGVTVGDLVVVYGSDIFPSRIKVKEILNDNNMILEDSMILAKATGSLNFLVFTGRTEWTAPIVISTQTMDSMSPRIMVHSSGSAFVAYENNETGNKDIYLRKLSYSPFYGSPQAQIRITNSRYSSKDAALAEDASGNVFVTWADSRNDKTKSEIFACTIDPGKQLASALTFVIKETSLTKGSTDAEHPRVIMAPAIVNTDAAMLVAYDDLSGSTRQIRVLRVTSTSLSASPQDISSYISGNNERPSISTNRESVLVAWQNDGLGTSNICAAWLPKTQTTFSSAERVTRSRGEAKNCDVLVDPSGTGHLVFDDDRVRTGYPSIYYARYSNVDGEWISSAGSGMEARVDTYMTTSASPTVMTDPQGSLVVLYEAAKDEVTSRIASCLLYTGVSIKPAVFTTQDDFLLTGVNYDNSLSGYFPLDDDSVSTVVENKIRRKTAVPPPLNVVIIIDTSTTSADALSTAKSAASRIVSLLDDADKLDVMTSSSLTSRSNVIHLFGSLTQATWANKTLALAFIAAPTGTSTVAESGSLFSAVNYSFEPTAASVVLALSQGETTDALGNSVNEAYVNTFVTRLVDENDSGASITSYSYQPTNSYLMEQITDNGGGFIEIYNVETVASGEETLVGSVTQLQVLKATYVMAPADNGTSSTYTNAVHVPAPDDNVSVLSPSTQGAFDLSSNGNVFSVPASLIGSTGTIEFWMKPHWDSTNLGIMVLFGNDSLTTTTPNTMSFGVMPLMAGNALRFRVVDSSGYVHQTEVQNVPPAANFTWAADEMVHVRAVWDNKAIGTSSINDMMFPSATDGFACGAMGAIFKTTNGGETWAQLESTTTYDLYAIDFVDSNNGLAVGEMGTILKTSDGGTTWLDVGGTLDNDLNGVCFRTSSVSFAVGSNGLILRTEDGGTTWTEITTGAVGDLRDVAVLRSSAEEAVVVIGSGGQIYRSTDDGLHFVPISAVSIPAGAPTSTEYMSISRTHQAGSYKSYIVGRSGMILRSSDAGTSWSSTVLNLFINPSLYGVSHAPTSDDVYAVGQDGMLIRSTDGGVSWVMYGTEVNNGSFRTVEANFGGTGTGLNLVAAGVGGSVMRSADGGNLQIYSITKSGNLTIQLNGKEPTQVRTGDVPFDWSSQLDLYFGDYEDSGSNTANAVIDELFIYKNSTPSLGSTMRRKVPAGIQPDISGVIHRSDLEKRIEWGHVTSVAASSYWTDVRLSLCSSFEPLQMFQWNVLLGLGDDVIRDMDIDHNNRLWMATENGISTADLNELNEDIDRWLNGEAAINNTKTRFVNMTNLGDKLPTDSISTICIDENNDLWAGTESNGLLYLIRNSTATSFQDSTKDILDSISPSVEGFAGSAFNVMTTADGLRSNSILKVRKIVGGVAVGTRGGLSIVSIKRPLTDSDVAVIDASKPSSEKSTSTAIVTEGNPLAQGAKSTTITEKVILTRAGHVVPGGVVPVTVNEAHEQVASVASSRVTKITSYGLLNGLPSETVQTVAQDKDGTLWVGTDSGLVKFSADASTTFRIADGLPSNDIYSIFFDSQGKRYIGTGYGLSVISGSEFSNYLSTSGIGIGVIQSGDVDANGTKWLATSVGLVEMRDDCDPMFRRYTVDDGLLGDPNIVDFQRYYILGNDLPWGGCDKILVMATVNGESAFGTYGVDASVPFIIFNEPLTSADKVEAYLYNGWREIRNFSSNTGGNEDKACVKTSRSTMPLYRKKFEAGDVVLGGNMAEGADNAGAMMYGLFVIPASGSSNPISSVSAPAGAVVVAGVSTGDALYSDDANDLITLPANEVRAAFHVMLPSAGQPSYSDEYVTMTLSASAWVYVAYDSRATQMPFWLRKFEPLASTYRIVDMETYDGNGDDKLYVALAGTNGCVYDVLHDPTICDISATIAIDSTGPVGCARITRVNSMNNVSLSLVAADDVSGVDQMQVSARADFTDADGNDLPWVPFAPSYNLELPNDVFVDTVVDEIISIPPGGVLDQKASKFFSYNGRILIMTELSGRVYELDTQASTITLLFDTTESAVTCLASFADKLFVGTSDNGRIYTWDGTTLSLLFEFAGEDVLSMASFDSTLFVGTGPNGRIYSIDDALNLSLFKATYETSVNGFSILGSSLFWATSNSGVTEGSTLRTTTTDDHAHSLVVGAGITSLSGINDYTSESMGHRHLVTDGILAEADGHTHALNGSKPGRISKYDPITGTVVIVHADQDYAITTIATIPEKGLLFAGTYPNGKIYRYVPGDSLFIKSFDTASEEITSLASNGGQMYASAGYDVYFFDGKRWQFMARSDEIVNYLAFVPGYVLMLEDNAIVSVGAAVNGAATSTTKNICAYVRFKDGVGNISTIKKEDGSWLECYNPCVGFTLPGGGGGGGGTGATILSHRLVEINSKANEVFSISGNTSFLSGSKIEEEVATYESEIFNGTSSLVQWTSISWDGTTPTGSSITMEVRSASTSADVLTADWTSAMTDSSGNDITNQSGQYLQFRATLKSTQTGGLSPELHMVHIEMRTAQATHFFTTHFRLPNDLRRGILTYNGCVNPPSTDIVFGVSGKDTTDFSEYTIITPNKVFEVPPEHQSAGGLRVGIKLISSPQTVPVVDEFALLFSLANDAIIKLNLPGTPSDSGPAMPTGTTRTVVTERVQDHAHTITFDALITDQFLISGRTSTNASHAHDVTNGVIQPAAGHGHTFTT